MNPESPQALWHLSPHKSALQEASLPADGINISTLYSLISIGTETLVAKGIVPAALADDMQVPYQEGSLSLPVKYGYSLVGKVNQSDHELHNKIVHLLHPHQGHVRVTAGDLFEVPSGIPARRATLASNLETAVNAVWDAGVSIGDRVLVVGGGMIGMLIADLVQKIAGTAVFLAEIREDRLQLAEAWGIKPWNASEGPCDVAFHTSVNEAGLQTAIDAVGQEGTIIELSWYGEKEVHVNLGGSFHSQRKRIKVSQVSAIPPERVPRWDYRRRKEVVFDLLQDPQFDRYLTNEVMFDNLPQFFHSLRTEAVPGIGWTVKYEQRE